MSNEVLQVLKLIELFKW